MIKVRILDFKEKIIKINNHNLINNLIDLIHLSHLTNSKFRNNSNQTYNSILYNNIRQAFNIKIFNNNSKIIIRINSGKINLVSQIISINFNKTKFQVISTNIQIQIWSNNFKNSIINSSLNKHHKFSKITNSTIRIYLDRGIFRYNKVKPSKFKIYKIINNRTRKK